MKVYFYPHGVLRDRQLDTIRNWPAREAVNPDVARDRIGAQVSRQRAVGRKVAWSWTQCLPLVNVKRRPRAAPADAVVYVWGGVVASGPFIVDLDNPYSLTGYNLRAMSLYRRFLRAILGGRRCVGIRCMSAACRETSRLLFGDEVYRRASVEYPHMGQMIERPREPHPHGRRFVFVGTQFEIKGGAALVAAFERVHAECPTARLDLISHVPPEFESRIARCPGITVWEPDFSRQEISERFLKTADVLVHPTYVDSFGMVVLEALAHGLAVIATDVYALGEMVEDGRNGRLIESPISIWDGYQPSAAYYDLANVKRRIGSTDTAAFEDRLTDAMLELTESAVCRRAARASLELFEELRTQKPPKSPVRDSR